MSTLSDILDGTIPQDGDLKAALAELKAMIDAVDAKIGAAGTTIAVLPVSKLNDALKAQGITGPVALDLGA